MLPTCHLLFSNNGIAVCISTVQHSWVGLKVISLWFVMFHICVHLQGRHRSWMLGNLFTRPQAEHRSVGSHTEITEIATLRCLARRQVQLPTSCTGPQMVVPARVHTKYACYKLFFVTSPLRSENSCKFHVQSSHWKFHWTDHHNLR